MPPMVCTHCSTSLADKYEAYQALRPEDDHEEYNRDGRKALDIFNALGVENFCCRSELMTCSVMIDKHNQYAKTNINARK